ncbi:mannose-ethanolamine phosphotransferase LAS21 Ecym_6288 [Eremothecium cymbalariae DBVPG|uniref:GPI ethanolamine phosphate transferase 2 n=1 Tax=Eremothecium cymbalariae (strain CBS 270.75 / DBVPG 7215 / KCTC 17166 / NRRL Y-17582) TaxID=931890 RepID=G8JVI9_ERECY|nr:hypothetical protein Ecym_6288 [Eremothecium cymbalariae DBVPG\
MLFRAISLLICQLVAILTFAIGFFPQKSVLTGDSEFLYMPEEHKPMEPQFEKMVVMVIDALRSDFLFQANVSGFHFVHDLINKGEAWGYTAYSNPPTVTLPRLKGITTGSMPNFLDAILNVAEDDTSSNLKDQDSWLSQLHKHGKRIHFYGDDTWLKLFPSHFFQRSDGTNSFFVSDFEEVDRNVTRHLPYDLSYQEWDILILHYLGLDHIGHKGGSASQFMFPKHIEMDAVIKDIYDAVDERTLVCVLGDHGMNDMGNHGGSSAGETSAAMVFISKKLANYKAPEAQRGVQVPLINSDGDYQYLTRIQQVDIVPTLVSLFNFPIPQNSVGIIIKDFLPLLGTFAEIKVKDNFRQLMKLANNTPEFAGASIDMLLEQMKITQDDLATAATNYNYIFLIIGLSILCFITIIISCEFYRTFKQTKILSLTVAISLSLGLSMFSSSFVEEEHQIWWWILTAAVGISWVMNPSLTWDHFLVSVCARLIRGWNNSGQKYIYENTIYQILERYPNTKWLINAATMFLVAFETVEFNLMTFVSSFVTVTLCLAYKGCWTLVNEGLVPNWLQAFVNMTCSFLIGPDNMLKEALVPLARLCFQSILASIVFRVCYNRFKSSPKTLQSIIPLINTILVLQTSPSNIPLFLLFTVMKIAINRILTNLSSNDLSQISCILSLIMQNFTFFQFGGTNSIATINLTNSYNGVSQSYNIYVVGFLTFISNFAPVIYWSLNLIEVYQEPNKKHTYLVERLPILFHYSVTGVFLLISCLALRYHLFIWSVFSPKLCYYIAWSILINGLLEHLFNPLLLTVTNK